MADFIYRGGNNNNEGFLTGEPDTTTSGGTNNVNITKLVIGVDNISVGPFLTSVIIGSNITLNAPQLGTKVSQLTFDNITGTNRSRIITLETGAINTDSRITSELGTKASLVQLDNTYLDSIAYTNLAIDSLDSLVASVTLDIDFGSGLIDKSTDTVIIGLLTTDTVVLSAISNDELDEPLILSYRMGIVDEDITIFASSARGVPIFGIRQIQVSFFQSI